jgi:hypothetical protein
MDQRDRENLIRTLDHRERVGHLIRIFVNEMMKRAIEHDRSKFEEPEFSEFAKYVPELEGLEYGSDEYQKNLNKLRSPALDSHYSNNDHHTEHFEEGVEGMDLFQICEMFLDWIAAGERHEDGDIHESIEIHYQSGRISKQTAEIMRNTADTLEDMGAIENKDES